MNREMNINAREMAWSIKMFAFFTIVSFAGSIAIYLILINFAQHQALDLAITTTTQRATAKVEVGARYTSEFWSILFFNSVALVIAAAGTGPFLYIHSVIYKEIRLRTQHPLYARLSSDAERLMTSSFKRNQNLIIKLKPELAHILPDSDDLKKKELDPISELCGYSKYDYRMFAATVPYLVPLLVLLANGVLLGMLLAYFTFNTVLAGYQVAGLFGMGIGLIYGLSYFTVSLIPHGIIEIPALLIATCIGYHFATIHSSAVIKEDLFLGEDLGSIGRDVKRINQISREVLSHSCFWNTTAMTLAMLIFAAYIETRITPSIINITLQYMNSTLLSLL